MPDRLKAHVQIIHVIGALAAGGAERFVVDLLRTLKARNASVGLLVLSPREDKAGHRMRQVLEAEGIPYACGPTERVHLQSVFWYLNKLYQIKPDIVHLHTENTELAHFLARKLYRRGHGLFRTIHNTDIAPGRFTWMAIHNNPALVSIACSDSVKDKVGPAIDGEVITVQNGIRFDWPIQTPALRERYRINLMMPEDRYHFLQVGRQGGASPGTAQKAHDVLIRAWRHGQLGHHGCILHLLGDGNLRQQLEQLAGNDESIVFHGIRDNVHDWLLAADCFVMPSRHEGLPIAGIEAVGTGLPCLFSDIPPLRELEPPAALWSPVDDFDILARNMLDMRKSRPRVSPDDAERVRRRFGIEETAARYQDCYRYVTTS